MAGLVAAAAANGSPPALAAFQGHNIVAVIFAPGADDPRFSQETAQLAKLTAQPAFQAVIVAGVADGTVIGVSDTPAALRARFGVAPGAFRFVLLGKDGRVALNQGSVVAQDRIAQAIKSMPAH